MDEFLNGLLIHGGLLCIILFQLSYHVYYEVIANKEAGCYNFIYFIGTARAMTLKEVRKHHEIRDIAERHD